MINEFLREITIPQKEEDKSPILESIEEIANFFGKSLYNNIPNNVIPNLPLHQELEKIFKNQIDVLYKENVTEWTKQAGWKKYDGSTKPSFRTPRYKIGIYV